jgi:hypothetical protein
VEADRDYLPTTDIRQLCSFLQYNPVHEALCGMLRLGARNRLREPGTRKPIR